MQSTGNEIIRTALLNLNQLEQYCSILQFTFKIGVCGNITKLLVREIRENMRKYGSISFQ